MTPEWLTQEEPSRHTVTVISTIVSQIVERHGDFKHIGTNDDLEAPQCLCGRVVNVVIWEAKQWSFINKAGSSTYVQAGKFIRIQNAAVKSDDALCKYVVISTPCAVLFRCSASIISHDVFSALHAHSNTMITPVPDSTFEVQSLLRNHHLRVQGNHPFNARSALLPLVLPNRVIKGNPLISNDFARQHLASESETRTLLDCILSPPTLRCKVRFYIQDIRNKPDVGSLSELVISNKHTFYYQLFVQARDGDIDLDLLVPDRVAENMLGITAREVVKESGESPDSNNSSAIRAGYERLVTLLQTNEAVEAPIWTVVWNERTYFVLGDEPVAI